MKRVGILTFHHSCNCGGVLQCVALYNYIKEMGFEVQIINYIPKYLAESNSIVANPIVRYKTVVSRSHGKAKHLKGIYYAIRAVASNIFIIGRWLRDRKFKQFRKNNLNMTEGTLEKAKLKSICSQYDYIIVGSDQIWNAELTGGTLDSAYFLDFTDENITTISYAASAGNVVREIHFPELKLLLPNIKFLSVREEELVKQIKEVTGRDAKLVLDPSLLISGDKWETMAAPKEIKVKYILVYTLEDNPSFFKVAEHIIERLGFEAVELGVRSKLSCKSKLIYNYDPSDFISLINNAEYIVTNSFHATVFSILFHKQFTTVPHTTRGARMVGLLRELNLESRLAGSINELRGIELEINYTAVEEKLKLMRCASKDFLAQALTSEYYGKK